MSRGREQPDRRPQPSLAQVLRIYRGIRTPPGFNARVAAALPAEAPRRVAVWQPVIVVVTLLLVLTVLAPQREQRRATAPPPIPSLAALSQGVPAKPRAAMPSLAQLRVNMPAMPKRPATTPPADPRTNRRENPLLLDLLKETTHG